MTRSNVGAEVHGERTRVPRRIPAALVILLVTAASPAAAEPPPALDEDEARYTTATRDYRETLSRILRRDLKQLRRVTADGFDTRIRLLDDTERRERLVAIAALERFLARYPHDARYTPDALFRLAELEFERAADTWLAATQAADGRGESSPLPDYGRPIALHRRLIAEHPDYRLLDGAIYQLGHGLSEMERADEARQAFLGLTCANRHRPLDPPPAPVRATRSSRPPVVTGADPYAGCTPRRPDSPLLAEVWTRIGEHHFEDNELDAAISAYRRALPYPDSPYYDKALYKLAWSCYRADRLADAVRHFDALLVWTEARAATGGASDLRDEALQYLGISLAEPDWDGDLRDDVPRPRPGDPPQLQRERARVAGLHRIESVYPERAGAARHPYVGDVYQRLGDVFFDQTDYLQAQVVYRRMLDKWPQSASAPRVQARVIAACREVRDDECVIAETRRMVDEYGARTTAWARTHAGEPDRVGDAVVHSMNALLHLAVEQHMQAVRYRTIGVGGAKPDAALLDKALAAYRVAADAYGEFLRRNPNAREALETRMQLADALFFSRRFEEAAQVYEAVRDGSRDPKLVEEMAFDAVKAREEVVDAARIAGRITRGAAPEAGKPVVRTELSVEEKALQATIDGYLSRVPRSRRRAAIAYGAATAEFHHGRMPEARARLEAIVREACSDPVALQAGGAILGSYAMDNDVEHVLEWTAKLRGNACLAGAVADSSANAIPGTSATTSAGRGASASAATKDPRREWEELEDRARYQRAQGMFDGGRYEEAAAAWLAAVEADPADRARINDKALASAAASYEKLGRRVAAARVHERLIAEHPESALAAESLLRAGVGRMASLDFEHALADFVRLADDRRFAGAPQRADALFNAGLLLEQRREHGAAAARFLACAREPGAREADRTEALLRGGKARLAAGDPKAAMEAWTALLALAAATVEQQVEARFHLAETLERQGQSAAALRHYQAVVDTGARVAPGSPAAEYPARAAFVLAERDLSALERARVTASSVAGLQRSIDETRGRVAATIARYEKVMAFQRATWSIAAYYRTGYCFEVLAKALLELPCPPEVRRLGGEACELFHQQVTGSDVVAAAEKEALRRYHVTVEKADRLGVASEWTLRARARIVAHEGGDLPRQEKVDLELDPPSK